MGLTSTTNRVSYTGDGSDTTFDYAFKIFATSELLVTVRNNTTNTESTQTLSSDYTVSGAGETGGGTVTFTTAPSNGHIIVIRRVMPLTQSTDIRNQGPYLPSLHEDQFDKLVMSHQQMQSQIDRCIKQLETDSSATLDIPISRVSSYMFFDASGNLTTVSAALSATATVSSFMETVLDDADALAARTTLAVPTPFPTYGSVSAFETVHGSGAIGDAFTDSTIDQIRFLDGVAWTLVQNTKLVSKTATYTILPSDYMIDCDASSAAFTATLPAVLNLDGRIYKIRKSDSDITNDVTVDGNGAETVGGSANTILGTQGETLTVQCDEANTNWIILERYIPRTATAYTPVILGVGSDTINECEWWREGGHVCVEGNGTGGTVTAAALTVALPTGLTGDYTTNHVLPGFLGSAYSGASHSGYFPVMLSGALTVVQFGTNASISAFTAANGNAIMTDTLEFSYSFKARIAGWNG